MTIPDGWRVAVIDPDGNIVETLDIEGSQLTKPLSAIDLGIHIEAAVERALGLDIQDLEDRRG